MSNLYRPFLELHQPGNPFIIPNPWDRGSAQILASMGFPAIATTSAGFAFTRALKDGQVGRDLMIEHCRDIVSAVDIPVSADLENCFAKTSEGIQETIRMAIDAGLAGCSIEDASGNKNKPIYDFEEAVDRTTAAIEAIRNSTPGFVLTARAENFLHGAHDLDDTIKRLAAFEAAGADVLYAPGLATLEQVKEVCDAVNKPVNVIVSAKTSAFTKADLADAGAARISLGSTLSRNVFHTFIKAAEEMRDHGTFSFATKTVGFTELESHFN